MHFDNLIVVVTSPDGQTLLGLSTGAMPHWFSLLVNPWMEEEQAEAGVIDILPSPQITQASDQPRASAWVWLHCNRSTIGNAHLEAGTYEKVCIKAERAFAPFDGHLLIIQAALHGLRSGGRRFGDLLTHFLKQSGFFQSKAESKTFMRISKKEKHFECLEMRRKSRSHTKKKSIPYFHTAVSVT